MNQDQDPFETYQVVTNEEEQYSLWPTTKPLPAGWTTLDVTGSKQDCLAYIESAWKDILPLSVRKRLEQAETAQAGDTPQPPA